MADSNTHTNRRCEKLTHLIAMKYDKDYRRKYLQGGTGYNRDELDEMKQAAISLRKKGQITFPGDEQRKFFIEQKDSKPKTKNK